MPISLDSFSSGHLVVSAKRDVYYCNDYIRQQLGWQLEGSTHRNLHSFFSKASNIFIDSYVYPLLIDQSHVDEIQLTVLTPSGERFPVIANIKMTENRETFWSLFICVNRDKLYQELIQAQERLEEQSKELLELATIDPLTGLLNRRELNNRADRMLFQTKRLNLELAMLVIDIDHFKKVNDSFGHATGDEALKHVSKIISNGRRNEDIVARWGGEEFVLLLSNTNNLDAVRIAEFICTSIESTSIEGVNITISIGIASIYKDKRDSFDNLFSRADAALLTAKRSGRNRVVVSEKNS
ncbi:MAG: diguanylate cyclase (GGDEF)-like protein [Urechidicola sp.]|jgi:diguanylate cyclase (GGDEF)-like protein